MNILPGALDSLVPVPPRYRAVHDELKASHIAFHDFLLTISNVKTSAQASMWRDGYNKAADRANGAIEDYTLVVGIALPKLKK